jgi:hypothetical protein
MSIVVGCDSFLALRNVRNGDLGRRLAGERVIVWVDPHQFAGSRAAQPEGVELGCLEDFDARQERALRSLLHRAYLARKCYYDPGTQWVDFRWSTHRQNRRNLARRIASIGRAAATLAGYWVAGRAGLAQRWRREFALALRPHPIAETYRRRLQEVGAVVVAAFSLDGVREMALIEAANSLGLRTAVMIRSRDNLTSKILHLPEADAYLVWSEATRQLLAGMYPEIPASRVQVVGSPQFAHHLDPAYRLEREAFFSLMGLDPQRPLIVYSMATPGLIDHEIDIAQHLADAAQAGAFVNGAQLLVRGHPRMFGSNVKLLHREYREARSYPKPTSAAFRSPEHEANVVRLIMEDEPVHLATLAYQDVQVNVCGTMTIDSAVLDKPTVNVYYDPVAGVPSGLSTRRFYERTDVRQMMAYRGSRLARSPNECIRLVNRYLEDPSLDAAGRKRARDEDCGPLRGDAGERIAGVLAGLGHQQGAMLARI